MDLKTQVKEIMQRLTMKEKESLLAGKDNWATVSIPKKGIYEAVVTDGPHGVRHPEEAGRGHMRSTFFPTGVSFASSWNEELVEKVGEALGEETRAANCDVLLGPCVNIIRHPLAGRNFESYSEDPYLAGRIGTAYVKGVQSKGVGTSLKHFACNNQEINRGRGSSVVDERTLREIYLSQFEMIVKEAKPWTVMCSYNKINGTHACANKYLLTDILRNEWGFDGVVMSDWGANHGVIDSLEAGLDLEMPGPAKYYSHLAEAVIDWKMDPKYIDISAERMLTLLGRVGKLEGGKYIEGKANVKEHQELARRLAEESIVLLKNEDKVLPIPKTVKKVAVIGDYANKEISGGGSSRVHAPYYVGALDALKQAYPDVEFVYSKGCEVDQKPVILGKLGFTTPEGNEGVKVEFILGDLDGEVVESFDTTGFSIWSYNAFDNYGINGRPFSIRISGSFEAERDMNYKMRMLHSNHLIFKVDGELVYEKHVNPDSENTVFCMEEIVSVKKGRHEAVVEYIFDGRDKAVVLVPAFAPRTADFDDEKIAQAADIARDCDYALVFAGMPTDYESEGDDRKEMTLLGKQDELIERVAAANASTIVVLHTGVPVEMPWLDKIKGLVEGFYYGQEGGRALASILFGDVNPSGRLSQTFPKKLIDTPAYINFPGDKEVFYGEGLFVGYRYYDYKNVDVNFPFGYGLSYTDFEYGKVECPEKITLDELKEKGLKVSVTVKNVGSVKGKEVVQLYVGQKSPKLVRPIRELKGFKKLELEPGEEKRVTFDLDYRSFAYYNPYEKAWVVDEDEFDVMGARITVVK